MERSPRFNNDMTQKNMVRYFTAPPPMSLVKRMLFGSKGGLCELDGEWFVLASPLSSVA